MSRPLLVGGLDALPTDGTAVILDAPGAEPRLTRRTVRAPEPGEALVAIEACGLCGSDRLLRSGGFGVPFPVGPGHESAGRVVAVGDPADADRLGRRVCLYYIAAPDGGTLPGRPNLGPGVRRMGVDTDGALAQFVTRPVDTLVAADDVPAPVAAVLADAVATAGQALRLGTVIRGTRVAVIGLGGVGSSVVQLAVDRGATAYVLGRTADRTDRAAALGAAAYLTSDRPVRELVDEMGGAPEVVVQCVGHPDLDRLAIELADIGGRVVLVGASAQPFRVCSNELIAKGLTVIASRGFLPADIADAVDRWRASALQVDHLVADVRPLADVVAAYADLDRGGRDRIVLTPPPSPALAAALAADATTGAAR